MKLLKRPFVLNAWKHPDGAAFYRAHVADLLPAAWKLLVEHFPKLTDKMLAAVPKRYRMEGTGFTKATVAWNNPVSARVWRSSLARVPEPALPLTALMRHATQTPMHYDDNKCVVQCRSWALWLMPHCVSPSPCR